MGGIHTWILNEKESEIRQKIALVRKSSFEYRPYADLGNM